ncbi:hypothetical protein BAUCODRAFT_262924 [Baudoinia panamericana UAMH 10762]|uniref:Uncharacterized protein n=1 Tax=Baudoinia panamericana (strain UAMH 10762) TaxID=717646 RepID=M2MMY0_BAUPA|nr:uncharacterized protein BAUCODRAFT_262924 [Baudoinia panamericana UAMH 10762]EMC92803.1 hypothetical protein BAUCODRAFT_262924 [Baudoinia panamericana UAMH 10762]
MIAFFSVGPLAIRMCRGTVKDLQLYRKLTGLVWIPDTADNKYCSLRYGFGGTACPSSQNSFCLRRISAQTCTTRSKAHPSAADRRRHCSRGILAVVLRPRPLLDQIVSINRHKQLSPASLNVASHCCKKSAFARPSVTESRLHLLLLSMTGVTLTTGSLMASLNV